MRRLKHITWTTRLSVSSAVVELDDMLYPLGYRGAIWHMYCIASWSPSRVVELPLPSSTIHVGISGKISVLECLPIQWLATLSAQCRRTVDDAFHTVQRDATTQLCRLGSGSVNWTYVCST